MVSCTVCGGEVVDGYANPLVSFEETDIAAVIEGVFCSKGCLYELLLNGATRETSNDATPRREAVEHAGGLQDEG